MKDTVLWYSIAKPNPTAEDAQTQAGVHLEEVNEMLVDGLGFDQLTTVSSELRGWAHMFKNNQDPYFIDVINRVELLDSICDQIVTGTALAKALGMDILGAFSEVEASNLSKYVFVDDAEITPEQLGSFAQHCNDIELQGRYSGVHWKRVNDYVVWYDQSGKILKGPNYFEPNLEEFV